jgi:hypothetical protein
MLSRLSRFDTRCHVAYDDVVRHNNPYRPQPGGDPPLLVGRDAEVQTFETTLMSAREGGPMRPTVFVGLRGMGKTALLRRCMAMAREDEAVVVGIEATEAVPLAAALAEGVAAARRQVSLLARFRDAVDGIRKALPSATYDLPGDLGEIELSLRGSDDQPPIRRVLTSLNDIVRQRGSYLVLAVDEIQEATVDDLRQIVMFVHEQAGTDRPVVLIGAGLTNSAAHLHDARTYTERWRYPYLGRVGPEETRAAIAIPAREQGVEFTADALDILVGETAGYPFFIQEYASVVWTFSSGPVIDRADVERRVAGVRAELDEQFYEPRIARLTNRECAYVLALADMGEGSHPVFKVAEMFGAKSRDVSSIRNQLIRKEVIFASGPGEIEFRMPLTDRYIMRNRESLERRARGAELTQFRANAKPGRSR